MPHAALLGLVLSLSPSPAPPLSFGPTAEPLAFRDVAVLDLDAGALVPHRTVVVRNGAVAAVGDADLALEADVRVVDAKDGVLMPGLAEMHGHLPHPNWPAGMDEDVLFLYLANGVTTVRGMLGNPNQLTIRAKLADGEWLGPRLFVGSPPLTGSAVADAEVAEQLVKSFAAAGYDHLKVHEGLKPEVYFAITAAAAEHGLSFGGHVSDLVGLPFALEAGQATIDHLDNVVRTLVPGPADTPLSFTAMVGTADEERIGEIADLVRQHGAAVVPTHALWRTFFGGESSEEARARCPESRYLPGSVVDGWATQLDQQTAALAAIGKAPARLLELRDAALLALHEAGVPILLGTDSPQVFSVPGFSIHEELQAMQAAGLTPLDALRSGTLAVAAYYEEPLGGRIVPGAPADLVLLEASPLEDLANTRRIVGVMRDGTWLSRDVLDARLSAIEERWSER